MRIPLGRSPPYRDDVKQESTEAAEVAIASGFIRFSVACATVRRRRCMLRGSRFSHVVHGRPGSDFFRFAPSSKTPDIYRAGGKMLTNKIPPVLKNPLPTTGKVVFLHSFWL